jgi:hypothetical protein
VHFQIYQSLCSEGFWVSDLLSVAPWGCSVTFVDSLLHVTVTNRNYSLHIWVLPNLLAQREVHVPYQVSKVQVTMPYSFLSFSFFYFFSFALLFFLFKAKMSHAAKWEIKLVLPLYVQFGFRSDSVRTRRVDDACIFNTIGLDKYIGEIIKEKKEKEKEKDI